MNDKSNSLLVGRFQRSRGSTGTKEALVALNFRVPFKLRQRMKLAATARDITMTQLLSAALENYLRKEAPGVSIHHYQSSSDDWVADEILNALKK